MNIVPAASRHGMNGGAVIGCVPSGYPGQQQHQHVQLGWPAVEHQQIHNNGVAVAKPGPGSFSYPQAAGPRQGAPIRQFQPTVGQASVQHPMQQSPQQQQQQQQLQQQQQQQLQKQQQMQQQQQQQQQQQAAKINGFHIAMPRTSSDGQASVAVRTSQPNTMQSPGRATPQAHFALRPASMQAPPSEASQPPSSRQLQLAPASSVLRLQSAPPPGQSLASASTMAPAMSSSARHSPYFQPGVSLPFMATSGARHRSSSANLSPTGVQYKQSETPRSALRKDGSPRRTLKGRGATSCMSFSSAVASSPVGKAISWGNRTSIEADGIIKAPRKLSGRLSTTSAASVLQPASPKPRSGGSVLILPHQLPQPPQQLQQQPQQFQQQSQHVLQPMIMQPATYVQAAGAAVRMVSPQPQQFQAGAVPLGADSHRLSFVGSTSNIPVIAAVGPNARSSICSEIWEDDTPSEEQQKALAQLAAMQRR